MAQKEHYVNASMMEIRDVDILLDVLGNETRRKIIQLLADEPRYFIQLSKDLGVSQQAVLKHLEILERHGFVSSYEEESDYAAPNRKYYQLSRSCMLAIEITKDSVEFAFREIPQHEKDEGLDQRHLRSISKDVNSLGSESDPARILNASDKILKEINAQLAELAEKEIVLLRMKQKITRKAHETIRDSFNEELQRHILYSTIGEDRQPNVDELSALLDTREKEIAAAMKVLRQRLNQ